MYKEYMLIVNTEEKGREIFWLATEEEFKSLKSKYEPWEVEAGYKVKIESEYSSNTGTFLKV